MENEIKYPSCGMSLEDHVKSIITGLVLAGVGAGCIDSYKAMVEVTEHIRKLKDYPTHRPTGIVAKIEEETKQLREQMAPGPGTRQ